MTPNERSPDPGPRVLLSHPSGNQFFRHLAVALWQAGVLKTAYTCIDWRGGWGLDRVLPPRVRAELSRRSFARALGVPVETHARREAVRLAAGRLGLHRLTTHETGRFSVDAVCRDFDRWVAARVRSASERPVVYAYEDAAEASFLAAKARGGCCVYDLPIAYWETSRRLLDEEAARWPDWEPTLQGTRDSPAKQERKSRELAAADLVICPSRFVAASLPESAERPPRTVIVPFGSPAVDPLPPTRRTGPLRVLFAGSLTQRKGLADLFAAVRLLGRREVELVVMGTPVVGLDFYRRQASFAYEPPRPHQGVLELMRRCDVLCLPSIVEGRALVIQEAMSLGRPVIVTPNTGTDDVVQDGVNGFVVPVRSPAAIADRLAWLAAHREALPDFGLAAAQATREFSWPRYGTAIVDAIRHL